MRQFQKVDFHLKSKNMHLKFLIFYTFYLFLSLSNNANSQFISKYSGLTQSVTYSKYTSLGIGYAFINGGYYKKNVNNYLKTKNFYYILGSSMHYAPIGKFASFNITNSISFETRRWAMHLLGLNTGVDLATQTDFKTTEYQINPKIGLTFFYGTIEIAYCRNILISNNRNFSDSNTFIFILRPFIFIKSQNEKWSH